MRNVTDPVDDPFPKRTAERRTLALVLGFVGAACLLLAAFSKSWMANPDFKGFVRDRDGRPELRGAYIGLRGDIRFGPTGFERCAGGLRGFDDVDASKITCETISTAEFNTLIGQIDPQNRDQNTSGAFSIAGWIAFGSCLLAAIGLLAAGGLALARKQKELPISPASLALIGILLAMASGCVFIATKPGPPGMIGVDLGFWAFGAGTVIGIVGAQLLAKEIRPPDPDLLEGAMRPDEFWALPAGRGQATPAAGVPTPMVEVAATQPVHALTAEQLGELTGGSAPIGAEPPVAESLADDSPAADSPGAESAAAASPDADSPAAEPAAAEPPAADSPDADSPDAAKKAGDVSA